MGQLIAAQRETWKRCKFACFSCRCRAKMVGADESTVRADLGSKRAGNPAPPKKNSNGSNGGSEAAAGNPAPAPVAASQPEQPEPAKPTASPALLRALATAEREAAEERMKAGTPAKVSQGSGRATDKIGAFAGVSGLVP